MNLIERIAYRRGLLEAVGHCDAYAAVIEGTTGDREQRSAQVSAAKSLARDLRNIADMALSPREEGDTYITDEELAGIEKVATLTNRPVALPPAQAIRLIARLHKAETDLAAALHRAEQAEADRAIAIRQSTDVEMIAEMARQKGEELALDVSHMPIGWSLLLAMRSRFDGVRQAAAYCESWARRHAAGHGPGSSASQICDELRELVRRMGLEYED